MNKYFFILFYLALIPFYPHVPLWSWLAAFLISVHAQLVNFGRFKMLNKYVMGGLALLAGGIVYYNFKTLLGPEPATALIVILCALKLEEIRTPRDGVVFNLLIILLIMYYLLLSQTLLATAYMIIMLLMVIIGLIKVHTPHEHFKNVILNSPKLVGRDLMICVPFFVLIFIFFPRFNAPWASLFAKEKQMVGFSEQLKPGDLARLALSEEPAYRVRFTKKAPPPSLMYWRGVVLDNTDGWNWSARTGRVNRKFVFSPKSNTQVSSDALYDYNIRMEPRFNKNIFTLGDTQNIKLENNGYNQLFISPGFVLQTRTPLINLTEFNVVGLVKNPLDEAFSSDRLMELTAMVDQDERTMNLVNQLKKNTTNALSYGQALLNYFRDNEYVYTLNTPDMPRLSDFLFQQKLGFCEHYAAAFASLMRLAGYPSRVVIGFLGGDYNRIADFYTVKDRHAHAWTEVYHDGAWYNFDATTVLNANRVMTGTLDDSSDEFRKSSLSQVFASVSMYYHALEMQYSNWLTEYNLEAQSELFNLDNKEKWLKFFIYFCLGLVGFIIVIYLFNLYLSRMRQDPLQMMWLSLKERMKQKGYLFSEATAPSLLFDEIRKHTKDSSQSTDQIIKDWLLLRYSFTTDSPDLKSIKKINQEMEKLISRLPKYV